MTQLRVLIANEKRDRLELLAHVVNGLGHDVIAREIYVKEVGAVTAREQPDVALVGLRHKESVLQVCFVGPHTPWPDVTSSHRCAGWSGLRPTPLSVVGITFRSPGGER